VKGSKQKASLRELALNAIGETRFVPAQGRNRIGGMIEQRPDWVLSRQRAWGVPITVFVHKETGEVIPNAKFKGSKDLQKRIADAFNADGADAWFADGAAERFLDGLVDNVAEWEQVRDILDVWFDSGSTHAFVLEKRKDLKWPADLYLEGSDQHRGWFHSSLLEACGTRGRAPYDGVLTHGFVMDEQGRKMSKSLGNTVAPQDVIKQSGADILRLWALSSDYTEDLRIGKTILQSAVDSYRKLRNTLRYLLGNLAHYEPEFEVAHADMPELERWVLHRVAEIDAQIRDDYNNYDFKRAYRTIAEFCSNDLSAVYFDIRKDTLYCEAYSSPKRRAALSVLNTLFNSLAAWLAPILCFTAEEAWLARHGEVKNGSVHLGSFPEIPAAWRDDALGAKWEKIWTVRRVVTGALEVERREKRIGASLEAAPDIYIGNKELAAAAKGADWAEIAITSEAAIKSGKVPANAFTLPEVEGVAVVPKLAAGKKCARSWRITDDVGADPAYPDLSARDAAAVREYDATPF
jgi:isoleucyl-tRNA synthetase